LSRVFFVRFCSGILKLAARDEAMVEWLTWVWEVADGNVGTLRGARGSARDYIYYICHCFVFFPIEFCSTLVVFYIGFECGGAEVVSAMRFKIVRIVPLSVYRLMCLRIH
jgi:hypothetical protein